MKNAKTKVDTDFSGPMGMMKLFQTILGEGGAKRGDSEPKVAVAPAAFYRRGDWAIRA